MQTGQTPLSIAQRLGYISVVEVLKHITEVTPQQAPPEEKYKVVSPETMQETLVTDSEDEGGMYFHCGSTSETGEGATFCYSKLSDLILSLVILIISLKWFDYKLSDLFQAHWLVLSLVMDFKLSK